MSDTNGSTSSQEITDADDGDIRSVDSKDSKDSNEAVVPTVASGYYTANGVPGSLTRTQIKALSILRVVKMRELLTQHTELPLEAKNDLTVLSDDMRPWEGKDEPASNKVWKMFLEDIEEAFINHFPNEEIPQL
ncbi:hypothetical protein BC939DRAFT_476092 [Gamsiella multidivaricata]|uniref:uncharacterized protein n=1 Tax=Gamsiella multidivaricata TaxID=101098 RepID=UPI0022204A85|nr:uncharacterized protein BC939DRAFT_476092 [Gamsiella multidivaricata]KAG0364812.1 hypothetical protein BGZ54_007127 [Gamsiella multidivaricata]KAI7825646.1 hypothetical protein BC939DRAFT_476092 [Gamsiella multidivaricata]